MSEMNWQKNWQFVGHPVIKLWCILKMKKCRCWQTYLKPFALVSHLSLKFPAQIDPPHTYGQCCDCEWHIITPFIRSFCTVVGLCVIILAENPSIKETCHYRIKAISLNTFVLFAVNLSVIYCKLSQTMPTIKCLNDYFLKEL